MNHLFSHSPAQSVLATIILMLAPLSSYGWSQTAELLGNDTTTGDNFGFSVALSGNTGIVGSWQDKDLGSGSGSAYLFDLSTKTQTTKLTRSGGSTNDYFGAAVGIDGNLAVVGAWGSSDFDFRSGAAFVYDVSSGAEVALQPEDPAQGDNFGISVGISGDVAIVGSRNDDDYGSGSGSAYLFNANTGQQLAKLVPTDSAEGDAFGTSVSISGDVAVVGALFHGDNHGAAYVFDVESGQQMYKLTPDDAAPGQLFGSKVAVSGNIAVVAAHRDGEAGTSAGAAYVFDITTGQQIAKLMGNDTEANDFFGFSVGIDGNVVIVGAAEEGGERQGAAYFFDANTGNQLAKVLDPEREANDFFGTSVAISGNRALVGASSTNTAGLYSGSAYLFESASNPIPEPGTLIGMIAMGLIGMVAWRKVALR